MTYKAEMEQNGIKVTDTMTLNAKGDKVQSMEEEMVFDTSTFEEDVVTQMNAAWDELVGQYKEIDGVKAEGKAGEGNYTIKVNIDTTGDAVEKLAAKGLLTVEGSSKGISLKATEASLTKGGYKKAE